MRLLRVLAKGLQRKHVAVATDLKLELYGFHM